LTVHPDGFNAASENFAKSCEHSQLVDGDGGLNKLLSEDGVHPNAKGYAIMRPLVRRALNAALNAPARR
jgi:lysophospholipase L1-like esterase